MRARKRIFVVPDVHQAWNLDEVEAAIAREAPDLTVFLGDYFDQFGDSPRDASRTALWLLKSIAKPDRVHLMGNHDVHYAYPACDFVKCSGWTEEKSEAIGRTFPKEAWSAIKLAHWEEDLLFTHAGWSRIWAPANTTSLADPKAYLDRETADARARIAQGLPHWAFLAGQIRGGFNSCGGLTWCDVREFRSIPGVNQVFGHTLGYLGPIANEDGVENWVCDTTDRGGVRHYLLVAEGSITAHRLDGAPVKTRTLTPKLYR